MRSYVTKEGLLTVTEDREIGNPNQSMKEGLSKILGADTTLRRVCESYAQSKDLKPFAMLRAERSILMPGQKNAEPDIEFVDGDDKKSVMEWVRKTDGRYANLLVDCPNPGNRILIPKVSLIVMNYDFGGCSLIRTYESPFKIVTPNGIVGELGDKCPSTSQ